MDKELLKALRMVNAAAYPLKKQIDLEHRVTDVPRGFTDADLANSRKRLACMSGLEIVDALVEYNKQSTILQVFGRPR